MRSAVAVAGSFDCPTEDTYPRTEYPDVGLHPFVREYVRRLRLFAWNREEHRPRAFVRVWMFLTAYIAIFVAIPLLVSPSGEGLLRAAGLRLLLVFGTVTLVVVMAYYIDRRPVQSFGLAVDRRWLTDAIVGIAIGGAIPTLATGLGLVGGWMSLVELEYVLTAASVRTLGLALLVTASIAIVEELVFRGYVLTNAVEGLDLQSLSEPMTVTIALGASAVFFATTHPILSFAEGVHFLGAGLLLGAAYLLTGELGLPIGIHVGFNFASEYVFQTTPGHPTPVVSVLVEGPVWVVSSTGVVHTAVQLPAALLVVLYVWLRSGRVRIHPAITGKLSN